jgi:hypothetical protein
LGLLSESQLLGVPQHLPARRRAVYRGALRQTSTPRWPSRLRPGLPGPGEAAVGHQSRPAPRTRSCANFGPFWAWVDGHEPRHTAAKPSASSAEQEPGARARQPSRMLLYSPLLSGARAAPHASRPSARQAVQPHAPVRAAPHASRPSARQAVQPHARKYVELSDFGTSRSRSANKELSHERASRYPKG